MVAKVGPIKGVRVPVKLPWKGVAHGDDQFVSMKKPVAEYLKLDAAKKTELTYKGEISYKERNEDGKPVGALKTKKVARTRRPGFKQRSIKVIFGDRKTGQKKQTSISGAGKRGSISFPVTKSVSITEIREEFIRRAKLLYLAIA